MAKGKRKFISQEYSTEQSGKNLKEGSRRSRGWTIAAGSFFGVSVVIGVLLITFSVMFFFSEVRGPSMMQTLNAHGDTDSVLVNRHARVRRGNIIIVRHYGADGRFQEYHIKRLLAIGGDSIHFAHRGSHFAIYVNDEELDNSRFPINGLNAAHIPQYANFFTFQQTGELPAPMRGTYPSRQNRNQAGFRTQTRDGVDFRQHNYVLDRWEIVLPAGYIFYMGDNRGGMGTPIEISSMSIDSVFFGPQPANRIVGVATEIIHNQTAPQWAWNRFLRIITFRW